MSTAKRRVATIQNYKDLFNTPIGKKVLLDLCRTHGLLDYSLPESEIDLFHKTGEQAVVKRILAMLRVDMDELNKEYLEYEQSLKMEG